jgi:hypothetical protein
LQFLIGRELRDFATGDLNGDGKADALVLDRDFPDAGLSVLLGDGAGGFQLVRRYPVAINTLSVRVGDFDGEGTPDLVVTSAGYGALPPTIALWRGQGDGTFQPWTSSTAWPRYSAWAAPVADLDGDGKADLLIAEKFGSGFSVLLGNGDGTFQPAVDYRTNSQLNEVVIGDFSGDGKLDVVTAGLSSASIRLGHGDGTLGDQVDLVTNDVIDWGLAAADFNGDGSLDLAIASQLGAVSVLLGNGDGTFQPRVDYVGGFGPMGLTAADLDGDGKVDLAVADFGNTVNVLKGNGDGTFTPLQAYAGGWRPMAVLPVPFVAGQPPALLVLDVGGDNVSLLRLCR